MATLVDTRILRTVHRILKQQTELCGRLERGPRRIAVAESSHKEFQNNLEELKKKLTQTKMSADAKQLQLKEREGKIEDLKNKRNVCESNREYQLLSDQIAADQQANDVLSDEIFEKLERIEVIEADIEEAKRNLAKAEEQTQTVIAEVELELSRVQQDLDRVTAELVSHEKQLPGDVRAEYKRMVEALGENALAQVDDQTCGHCYRILIAQVMNDLMMSNAVFCKSCGSLLYLPEDATVQQDH